MQLTLRLVRGEARPHTACRGPEGAGRPHLRGSLPVAAALRALPPCPARLPALVSTPQASGQASPLLLWAMPLPVQRCVL